MSEIHHETLFIDGPCGPLEARWDRPARPAADAPCAILCHPHPLHGGTLTNKVVHTLALTLARLGVCALRFNFRGVGNSAGTYDGGQGETEDLLAVIDHLQRDPATALGGGRMTPLLSAAELAEGQSAACAPWRACSPSPRR